MSFWDRIKHFEAREWRQDPSKAAPALVLVLDRIRERAGCPIVIHECWAPDGHAERSLHYEGRAVGFRFLHPMDPTLEFLCLAGQPELGAIGWYPDWSPRPGWHVDLRPWGQGRTYWVRVRGAYHTEPGALARELMVRTRHGGWL